MKLTLCDACGGKGASNQFSYRIHLDRLFDGTGYVDSDGNRVSGRDETIDLCNRCYNLVVSPAVHVFRTLREKYTKELDVQDDDHGC